MSSSASSKERSVPLADLVITLLLLGMFIGAYLFAEQWPFRAAFFPQLLAMAGIGLAVLKLLGFVVGFLAGRRADAEAVGEVHRVGDAELISDEEEEDESLEYVFATAGKNAWAAALGWIAVFFLALYLFGVFVAVPLFAFGYIKFSGSGSWLSAGLYAFVAWAVLYLAFARLLTVPMPEGIF